MNLFGTKKTTTSGSTGNVLTNLDGGPLGGTSHPYAGDYAMPMPNANSAASIEAARQRRAEVLAKYGRNGTRLVSEAGTRPYVNAHLGGS